MFFLSRVLKIKRPLHRNFRRTLKQVRVPDKCAGPHSRGLVLGIYSNENDKKDLGNLTTTAQKYNELTNGKLLDLLYVAGPLPKRGECRIFFNLEKHYTAVSVCGLGSKCLGYNASEMYDESKEAVRIAAAIGCNALSKLDTRSIYVENFEHTESAAEGAYMSIWTYQDLKNKKNRRFQPQIELHVDKGIECDRDSWAIGMQKASAQNLARFLMETPSNLLTPTKFAQNVVNVLCDSGVNVEIKVHGWAESKKMNSFLAVSKGSCQPPIFLELSYNGGKSSDQPIVLIGQGSTFDSGGISRKSCKAMQYVRGDMCGAACVVATCRAIASLRLPINIRGLIPLCENLIGCNAIKPGDIVTAMNGTSIEIENTDQDGPLILVDALIYAQSFCPKYIVDVATISTHMDSALGPACSGIFTNSEFLWQEIRKAAVHTGDRVWRMPLWQHFSKQLRTSSTVDVQNVGVGRGGGACKAAAFLREFVKCGQWLHVDAHGCIITDGKDFPYLQSGMAGRPTRTLIEFIAQTVCTGDGRVDCAKTKS